LTGPQAQAFLAAMKRKEALGQASTNAVVTPNVVTKKDVCSFRHEAIGEGDCGCSTKPTVYRCSCPEVAQQYCMLWPKRIRGITFYDGRKVKVQPKEFIPVCNSCKFKRVPVAGTAEDACFSSLITPSVMPEPEKSEPKRKPKLLTKAELAERRQRNKANSAVRRIPIPNGKAIIPPEEFRASFPVVAADPPETEVSLTIACIDCNHPDLGCDALVRSCRNVPHKRAVMFCHERPEKLPEEIEWQQIPKLETRNAYNVFALQELYKHVTTSHIMTVQSDGYVLRPELFDEKWLEYDYIGAPWAAEGRPDRISPVGNSGLCIRSKRLLKAVAELATDERIQRQAKMRGGQVLDDIFTCHFAYDRLVEAGLKFAPLEVAGKFSWELQISGLPGPEETFGFHNAKRAKLLKNRRTICRHALELPDGVFNHGTLRGVITGATARYWSCLGALASGVAKNELSFAVADHGLEDWQREELSRLGALWVEHAQPALSGANCSTATAAIQALWKPNVCAATPFDKTIWVDADAVVIGDIRPLFELLDSNCFCSSQHAYTPVSHGTYEVDGFELLPKTVMRRWLPALQCINTGFVGFRRDAAFLAEWLAICEKILAAEASGAFRSKLRDQFAFFVAAAARLEAGEPAPLVLDASYNWPADGLSVQQQEHRKQVPADPNAFYKLACERHPEAKVVHWLGPEHVKPWQLAATTTEAGCRPLVQDKVSVSTSTAPPSAIPDKSLLAGAGHTDRRLAYISTFFNLAGAQTRRNCLRRFLANLPAGEAPVFIVEGYLAGNTPELPAQISGAVTTLHVPVTDIIWHKERLLNLAIERLPDVYDAVCWIDSDIVFLCENITDSIVAVLRDWPIAQPWQKLQALNEHGNIVPRLSAHGTPLWENSAAWANQCSPGNRDKIRGAPAGAICARRETIVAMGGIFDAALCSSNDLLFLRAIFNQPLLPDDPLALSNSFVEYYDSYRSKAAATTRGALGHVAGDILHFFHGKCEFRQHEQQRLLLRKFDYSPQQHLRICASGAYGWSETAPAALITGFRKIMTDRMRTP